MTSAHIGIIGAGITGLSAAHRLSRAGVRATIVDKGSRAGGRCASRITPKGFQFDHGGQYASARGDAFARFVSDAHAAGHLERWAPAEGDGEPRWVAAPTMNAIAVAFATGQPPLQGFEVDRLAGAPGSWEFIQKPLGEQSAGRQTGAPLGPFDAVIVTAPQPQTHRLLAPFDFAHRAALNAADLAPCWSMMVGFTGVSALIANELPAMLRDLDSVLGFVARQESRPRLPTTPTEGVVSYLINATPGWSRTHLEEERPEVIQQLMAHCTDALPAELAALFAGQPEFVAAHRWRYALVETPAGRPCLPDEALRIVAAGDWCIAPRIEAAFDSGLAAAEAVMGWIGQR